MKSIVCLLLCCAAAGGLAAQTTLQVASRNIRKTIGWKPGYELIVNGEKAEVVVTPVDTPAVIVQAELSAKHPNLDTATYDLDAWQFVVSTAGKKIYVRAYIGVSNGKKLPSSNMKVKINVSAPNACPVNLSNRFGKARLEKLEAPVVLNGEFCQFQLFSLSGPVDIKSQYGSIEGRQLDGIVAVQAKRADIRLEQLGADCNIQSEYGQITLGDAAKAGNLKIVGNKSDITLDLSTSAPHNVSLHAAYGAVESPPGFDTSASTADNPRASLRQTPAAPNITVETTFGKIIIKR